MIWWKAVAKNFETDYNSHILRCQFKLGVGGGNCQITPNRTTLKDQTPGATNCSLSLFKFIYVSVKDLKRMLLNLHYTVPNQAVFTY